MESAVATAKAIWLIPQGVDRPYRILHGLGRIFGRIRNSGPVKPCDIAWNGGIPRKSTEW
ncbi:MAG: hypothetical protein JWL90_4044 [Chthoniobacteraceae bacterium]|nr:hypothetical protein [Chthoniobacteraceae bacterium]